MIKTIEDIKKEYERVNQYTVENTSEYFTKEFFSLLKDLISKLEGEKEEVNYNFQNDFYNKGLDTAINYINKITT